MKAFQINFGIGTGRYKPKSSKFEHFNHLICVSSIGCSLPFHKIYCWERIL